jgi:hypothetical protein
MASSRRLDGMARSAYFWELQSCIHIKQEVTDTVSVLGAVSVSVRAKIVATLGSFLTIGMEIEIVTDHAWLFDDTPVQGVAQFSSAVLTSESCFNCSQQYIDFSHIAQTCDAI